MYIRFSIIFILLVFCSGLSAQKKDSAITKPLVVNEDQNVLRKRKYNYFISDRLSDDGKLDVFKTTPFGIEPSMIIVRGHLEVQGNPDQKKGRINVYNASNNDLIGVFSTNAYTGNYLLILVPNIKYIFKIEVSGYGTLTETVEVPMKIDYEVCHQEMLIRLNEKKKPVVLINNFFSDEHEKVFYLKGKVDTSRSVTEIVYTNSVKSTKVGAGKNDPAFSTVDEMVKKQIEEERKKPIEALKAFKLKDYETALAIYSGLMKNDPGDPFVNYYYGVCLFQLNKNKTKAISALHLASNYKEVPYDVFYYLGRSYHSSYLFQNALAAFETYKKVAKPLEVNTNKINILVKNCQSGIELMNEQINIDVLKRTDINKEDLLLSYNPELINDAVKYKTDFFNSIIDMKKAQKMLVTNLNQHEYVHVSYGINELSGTDLFKNTLLPNGKLSASSSLGLEINTPLDENYPYLSKDGRTLYFSSTGHNSMGGYDIFKCTRKDSLSAWSKPQNMGYPINSTYDDILFVADTAEMYASFCTNRKNNKFEYTQIKMPYKTLAVSIIKGAYSTFDTLTNREAFISVYNSNTGELAGAYKTNALTGQYLMVLSSGQRYEMVIENGLIPEFTVKFDVPDKRGDFILKQTIKFQKEGSQKSMKVKNYFTEAEAENLTFDVPVKKATVSETLDEVAPNKKENKRTARTPEELKKDAEDLKTARSLYDQAIYQEAASLYGNIESHINLDAENNFYYGMSLYHAKKDKAMCIKALEAGLAFKSLPDEAYYYLARANYYSYRFASAIKYYKKFQAMASPAEVQKLNIEKEIEYCNNSIRLVNNPVVLEVYEKKHVDHLAIQNSLTHLESGSKILVITDDMRSALDKKKNFKSLLYLSPDKSTLLYSSYGEDESKGKDIYMLKKLSNGKWSPLPMNISNVNSNYDEEFPSLSKDGKTLYFSSKGFENMGGYDVFRSEWDEVNQSWSTPVNMGSPVNSPYDDIYFLE